MKPRQTRQRKTPLANEPFCSPEEERAQHRCAEWLGMHPVLFLVVPLGCSQRGAQPRACRGTNTTINIRVRSQKAAPTEEGGKSARHAGIRMRKGNRGVDDAWSSTFARRKLSGVTQRTPSASSVLQTIADAARRRRGASARGEQGCRVTHTVIAS